MKFWETVCMNKICLVARNFDTYFIKKLIEEVGEEGVIRFNPWEDKVLPVAKTYWVRTSGVYRDDKDLDFLNEVPKDAKVVNSLESLKRFREKESQYQFFKDSKLPHLSWLNLNLATDEEITSFLKKVGSRKYLIKPNRGQGGWGISVHDKNKFLEFWHKQRESGDVDYLLQPYIEDKIEYRLFFIGNRMSVMLEREAEEGVPANFSQGGKARVIPVPSRFQFMLKDLIKKSGAQYGAIDLLLTKNGPMILELNTTPGIEQLEEMTGAGIIRMILNYLP